MDLTEYGLDPAEGLKHIYVQGAPQKSWTWLRDFWAIQSALHRGDDEVSVHNVRGQSRDRCRELQRLAPFFGPPSQAAEHMYKGEAYDATMRPPETHQPARAVMRMLFDPETPWRGFRLEFARYLGRGGFGIVVLAVVHYDNGNSRKVAIKIPLHPGVDIQKERDWHQRYGGAAHTIQHVDLARLAQEQTVPGLGRGVGTLAFDEQANNILVIEYAQHGDLHDLVNTSVRRRMPFPNNVLWSLWNCLIKAVATVDYLPHANKTEGLDFEAWLNDPKKDPSSVPEFLKDLPVSHDVHFDNNFSNVLVSKGGDEDHGPNPVLKLHDFGTLHSKNMPFCWSPNGWSEEAYWRRRFVPQNTMTPEQMAREWDDLEYDVPDGQKKFQGADLTKGSTVAGRYGSWTNVFLIGRLMEKLITRLQIAHPFNTQEYEPENNIWGKIQTYGWRLTRPEYDTIDPQLKDIILGCQAHDPKQRPKSTDLLQHAAVHMPKRPQGQPDPELRQFWIDFWDVPPPSDEYLDPYGDMGVATNFKHVRPNLTGQGRGTDPTTRGLANPLGGIGAEGGTTGVPVNTEQLRFPTGQGRGAPPPRRRGFPGAG